MNREIESMAMRPLAKDLTRSLEEVRNITRDQSLRDLNHYTERIKEALRHFDGLFAEFELRYLQFRFLHPPILIDIPLVHIFALRGHFHTLEVQVTLYNKVYLIVKALQRYIIYFLRYQYGPFIYRCEVLPMTACVILFL